MNTTNLTFVGSNKSSPNDNETLPSALFDVAEFDEKYGHGIGVDECLKLYLTRFANGATGGSLLDQLAECMVRQGKKCHIVSASTATDAPLRTSPETSDTVFLTLVCDRLAKSSESGPDAVDEMERDLERQIMTLLADGLLAAESPLRDKNNQLYADSVRTKHSNKSNLFCA